MKKILAATLLLLATLSTGCASTKMTDSATQVIQPTPLDQAQVVFLRVSSFGGAIQASVFDATGPESEFIGILSSGKKLAYLTSPGRHKFMVVSEAADFLEAELLAGKTYYAIATPRMGVWKARFSLYPIRSGADDDFSMQSEKFAKWIKNTDMSINTAESLHWAEQNSSSIADKRADYEAVWATKSETELKDRTLLPEDGI